MNVDIFGNKPHVKPKLLHKNEKNFNSVPAFQGLRNDASRQFLMDSHYKGVKPAAGGWNRDFSHLDFRWKEEPKTQLYDKFVVPKIGSGEYRSRISRRREAEDKVLNNIK